MFHLKTVVLRSEPLLQREIEMKKLINRYFHPTPKKWRMIGDMALVMIPAIDGFLAGYPGIDESTKYIIAGVSNIVLVGVKFMTNFAKENPSNSSNNDS